MKRDESIVFQLRQAAMHCADQDLVALLRGYADLIVELIANVERARSLDSMTRLNGAVACALKAYDKARMPPDNPPRAGAMKEQLAA